MLKKFSKLSIAFVALFCFKLTINAYEFINPDNEERVNKSIKNIYEEKELYDELSGITKDDEFDFVSSNLMWWPIGSDETTTLGGKLFATGEPRTTRTSNGFGCGGENAWRTDGCHAALDMGDGSAPGVVNIIAAKDGIVVYPTKDSQTQFEDKGYYGNPDGGGCGNYVLIQHSDGIYTMYCHLAKNSITVRANESVKQGQVIGKMGHSGSSTGPHLHFAVRVGGTARENAVDPLEYIDPSNPRPQGSNSIFSLTSTTLSKSEFVKKMNDYCDRSKNKGFCNNFAPIADSIYDTSVRNGVNPELVVVTAGTEQSWDLSSSCKYTNNYWGIDIKNGDTCDSGGIYSSITEGIVAYANLLADYKPGGYYASEITNVYNERKAANCDTAGHGLPGTLEGMQSTYSSIGRYRYNPGKSGLGGCYYLNNKLYNPNYCDTVPTCTNYKDVDSENVGICPEESKPTVCEQNDYTAYQVTTKKEFRFDIFGL